MKYADDVSIFHFVRDSSQDRLQLEWNNLVHWSESMSLPLNFVKCHVVDFVTKKNLILSPVVLRDKSCLNSVSSISFLGVTFSDNMKWDAHIDKVVNKATKRLFLLRNLRRSNCPVKSKSKSLFFAENMFIVLYVLYVVCLMFHHEPCMKIFTACHFPYV